MSNRVKFGAAGVGYPTIESAGLKGSSFPVGGRVPDNQLPSATTAPIINASTTITRERRLHPVFSPSASDFLLRNPIMRRTTVRITFAMMMRA